MTSSDEPDGSSASTVGRPRTTTRSELAMTALSLFAEHGFEATSVDDVAAAAGISRRTFFRYFPTKSAVLWRDLDEESDRLRALLAGSEPSTPMMSAIREAVVEINRARRPRELTELRARMELVASTPVLQQAATTHYDDWSRAVSDFAATRLGVAEQSLFPVAIGRSVLACSFAAFDLWAERGERSLAGYLDEALAALAEGFDETALAGRTSTRPFTRRRRRGVSLG